MVAPVAILSAGGSMVRGNSSLVDLGIIAKAGAAGDSNEARD